MLQLYIIITKGHCCYSCRAFFRRTTQRVKMKGLKKCKTGLGRCDVSEDAKSCINCRYNKCLRIGMTPDMLQGKRKREEEVAEPEPDDDDEEDKVLSEPTSEKDEEPEPTLFLMFSGDIAEQPEQDQPLKLVKKSNTQHREETGKILNLVDNKKCNILFLSSAGPSPSPSSHSSYHRPSVIKYGSGSAAAAHEVYSEQNFADSFLRCESEMLRHQSSILMQAGRYFPSLLVTYTNLLTRRDDEQTGQHPPEVYRGWSVRPASASSTCRGSASPGFIQLHVS